MLTTKTTTTATTPSIPSPYSRRTPLSIELDAACAVFARTLAAYRAGDLQRLDAEREWKRWALKRTA